MSYTEYLDGQGNAFYLSLVEVSPSANSVYPQFEFNLRFSHKQGNPFMITHFTGTVRITTTTGRKLILGNLIFNRPMLNISPGQNEHLQALLSIDHYGLSQIERHRGNDKLQMQISFQACVFKDQQGSFKLDTTNLGYIEFSIAKSEWIENFLPRFEYKDVQLLEIPKINLTEFSNIAEYLNDAWKHISRGQYDNVLINCRKTIEELSEIVKNQGFERKITLDSGEQRTIPDWKKFLNQEDMGKNVEEITENIRKYCNLAAHRGKSINKEDADYAIMITHATVNLVLKNI